jgi:hypothetical protein
MKKLLWQNLCLWLGASNIGAAVGALYANTPYVLIICLPLGLLLLREGLDG